MSACVRLATLDDARTIAQVHVHVWRATYVGIMPQAVLDGLSVDKLEARWQRFIDQGSDDGVIAAFAGLASDRIVGFAICCEQRSEEMRDAGFTGEFQTIHILPEHQGKGLGRQMMAAMARALIREGHIRASCWAAKENHPSRRFYERLGGRAFGEQIDTRLNMRLEEVGYVWEDVRGLI